MIPLFPVPPVPLEIQGPRVPLGQPALIQQPQALPAPLVPLVKLARQGNPGPLVGLGWMVPRVQPGQLARVPPAQRVPPGRHLQRQGQQVQLEMPDLRDQQEQPRRSRVLRAQQD